MFKRKKTRLYFIIQETEIRYIVGNPDDSQKEADFGTISLPADTIRNGILENPAAFERAIRVKAEAEDWKGYELSFCLPDSAVTLRTHQVPKQLKQEEILPFLYTELKHTIQLPFEDPVLDFTTLEEKAEETAILLVAYPGDRVDAYQAAFEQAGLVPIVADLASLSLYRIYHQHFPNEAEDHLLLLQWNNSGLLITAFHHDQPQFIRQSQNSFGNLLNTIEEDLFYQTEAERASAYFEEQLTEITRFMDFYQYSVMNGEAAISKLLVSGDYAGLSETVRLLQERLNLETITFSSEQLNGLPVAFADAYGLSLKGY